VTRPPAPPLTPAEQDRIAAFEAAQYPAEVAERLEWPLGWKPGACTECGAAKADCTAPDYCCAECLHLADGWEGYDDAAPDRPDTAAEVEAVERALRKAHATASLGNYWRDLARAALAARRPATEAEQAVERVRELADELDLRARTLGPQASDYDRGYTAGLTDGETYAADRIRAALDGAARDGSDG
jgi:hypothetical protein